MHQIRFFRPMLLALSLALAGSNVQASMVRNDVDYQYFRDFAENKGVFSVGAKNIPIFNKQGQQVSIMLPHWAMPDLHVASRVSGVATLFNPQYIASVKHNLGYGSVQFGENSNNADNHHFNYLITERNNHPTLDFHAPRLHKLVTEVAPISLNNIAFDNARKTGPYNNAFLNKNRYPYFVRVGSGTQYLRSKDGKVKTSLTSAYNYLTGGTPLKPNSSMDNWVLFNGDLYDTLGTYGLPGDSGSALLAYDAKEQRWVLVGVLSTYAGYDSSNNIYTIIQPDTIEKAFKDDETTVQLNATRINWNNKNNGISILQVGNQNITLPVTDLTKKSQDNNQFRPSLENGKTIHFQGGEGSTLILKNNINQGAGALHFNQNMTVQADNNDYTWLGAGIVVNGDKTVHWRVKNPENDRLSKLGTGTLYIDGQGKNLGYISVGDGTVVLDQKMLNGQQQAFNQVGITSGRATVVLANNKQVNPDNIYFGFRGGRLDINGNNLTFHRIQNADEGAKIVNNNRTQSADIHIIGRDALTEQNIEWVKWGQEPTSSLAIYEYKNNYRNNRLDYFRLKEGKNPHAYFPWDMETTNDWEFLGNDRQQVIKNALAQENAKKHLDTFSGFLGEYDSQRYNGALTFNYNPNYHNSVLVLNGGTNLNGNLNISAGHLVLSGIPTPHAYDHLNQKEVIDENSWINRQFKAHEFNVSGNGKLESSRNVSLLEGNINARHQAQIQLGFTQNKSSECIRASYTGVTSCTENKILSQVAFDSVPVTVVSGNIDLKETSQFNLGKAHLVGRINATPMTQIRLQPYSQWMLTGNSTVGNLEFLPNSQVTLNTGYDELNKDYRGWVQFNELTINGRLTGNGHFRFLTNVAERRGDHITVNGLASGAHLLSVKNTGREPNEVNPLSLVKLNHPEQAIGDAQFSLENGYVDLGAYRYILTNRSNDYRLYNPLRDAELHSQDNNQLILNSQREFEAVQNKLNSKRLELANLTREYSHAQKQKTEDDARIERLLADIRQTNNQIDNVFYEYNRTWRIRFIKRRNLYNQFTQYKARLENQRNEYRGLRAQAEKSENQAQKLLQMLTGMRNTVNTLSTQYDKLQAEFNRLKNDSQMNKASYAQWLCEVQGLSSDICRKVAKVADESGITAFEAEIDANIIRVESAQQTLINAQTSGNQSAVNSAQVSLNEAVLALLNSLEKAYQTEQEIQQFLSSQSSTVALPVQAQLISRYSNTALSELSANVNSALQIGRNLDRHLLSQDKSNVWVNAEASQRTYRSNYNRPYKQNLTLTQVGVAQALNPNVQIGAVLSHSRANNELDENISATSRLTAINGFVKGEWNNGIFASFDLGYGHSRNNIKFDEENKTFHRNIFSAGGNIGASLDWGIHVTPSVGMRYYRLSSTNYQLAGANINSKTLHLTTYRAGVMLDKTFDINGVKFTPSFSSNYYDATQRKLAINGVLSVNDVALKQQFGRYFTHELGFSAQMKQWNISTNIGMLKGSDVAPQKFASLKIGFTW